MQSRARGGGHLSITLESASEISGEADLKMGTNNFLASLRAWIQPVLKPLPIPCWAVLKESFATPCVGVDPHRLGTSWEFVEECRVSGHSLDPLDQDLHFNKTPGGLGQIPAYKGHMGLWPCGLLPFIQGAS